MKPAGDTRTRPIRTALRSMHRTSFEVQAHGTVPGGDPTILGQSVRRAHPPPVPLRDERAESSVPVLEMETSSQKLIPEIEMMLCLDSSPQRFCS